MYVCKYKPVRLYKQIPTYIHINTRNTEFTCAISKHLCDKSTSATTSIQMFKRCTRICIQITCSYAEMPFSKDKKNIGFTKKTCSSSEFPNVFQSIRREIETISMTCYRYEYTGTQLNILNICTNVCMCTNEQINGKILGKLGIEMRYDVSKFMYTYYARTFHADTSL